MPIVDTSCPPSDEENQTKCYICLGVEEENDDPPLRRDCSCRGSDAGFVHLECLVENAKNRSTRWDGRDLVEFTRPWEVCPICCKFYQSTLAVDISTEFLTFVQETYPGDTRKQIEALDMRLGVLVTMRGGSLQPADRIETSEVANQILALIAQLKSVTPKLSASYLMREAHAYKSLGQIALQERTRESAMRAVTHFEMQLELEQAIGDVEGTADARFSIALARSKYEGSNAKNNEALLKVSHDVYTLYAAELGEEDAATSKSNQYHIVNGTTRTITSSLSLIVIFSLTLPFSIVNAGGNYAISLANAKRGVEAETLLTDLVAMSTRNHGSHHRITKSVEHSLQWVISNNAKSKEADGTSPLSHLMGKKRLNSKP